MSKYQETRKATNVGPLAVETGIHDNGVAAGYLGFYRSFDVGMCSVDLRLGPADMRALAAALLAHADRYEALAAAGQDQIIVESA